MAMVVAMTILRRLLLLLVLTIWAPMAVAAERGPLILAAASLQESLTDAADAWAAQGHALTAAVNLSAKLLRELGGSAVIGPMLIGMEKPVQVATMSSTASDLVTLAVLAAGGIAQ